MDINLIDNFEMSVFNLEIELSRITEYARKLDSAGKLRLKEFAERFSQLAKQPS